MSSAAADPDPGLLLTTSAPPDRTEETSDLIGRGTLIMIAATLAFFTFSFIARVAAARLLPVQAWGAFNLGVSFTAFVSVVILLGLNNAVARCLVTERDPAGRRAIVRWSLWVSAALSVAASVATYVFAGPLASVFHEPGLTLVFQLLAASVGLGAMTPMFAAVFQGFHDMLPNAWFNQVLNPAVFVVTILGLLYLHWGLEGALIAYLAGNVAAFVASVAYYTGRIGRHIPRSTPSAGRPSPVLWSSAVALWGIGSLAFVTAYADTLLLGVFRPALDVGYYSAAMALARTLLLGGAALTFVFLPMAAHLSQEGDLRLLRRWYTVSARWIVVVSLPLFLLFVLMPTESVQAIFGAKYLPATAALQVLSITGFVAAVVGPSNACLAGLGRDRANLLSATFSGVTNVAVSLALIPLYGVLGAAIAWGVARAIYPASNLVILQRDYGIQPFQAILWKPLVLTLAITGPIFLGLRLLTHAAWIVYPLFFVGLGIFLGSLLVTRSVVPEDLTFVRAIERLLGVHFSWLRSIMTGRYASQGPGGLPAESTDLT
jgi:O-antigen/teichoic acid export membrane protein